MTTKLHRATGKHRMEPFGQNIQHQENLQEKTVANNLAPTLVHDLAIQKCRSYQSYLERDSKKKKV